MAIVKLLLKIVGIVILLVVLGFGTLIYLEQRHQQERKNEYAKVAIDFSVTPVDGECSSSGYPYMYLITNGTGKTVRRVRFYVEITKKGFSTPLNSSLRQEADKILKPGERYGWCFSASKDDSANNMLTERDVDFRARDKFITFEE